MVWFRFTAVQLISLFATVVGWLLLIPFCLLQFWHKDMSINGRPIDVWRWTWLNRVYGNPEDGVSGQQALIWDGGQQITYMPNAWAPWRAYLWSGWRNSADNLKYVFACSTCPLVTFKSFRGRTGKIGWQEENGYKVPVLSL